MLEYGGTQKVDVLVVGSGAAGCRAAIEAAEYGARVALVSKGALGRSGTTNMAEVVYAAAISHTDTRDHPWYHFEDTVMEGHWIGDQKLIKLLTDYSSKTVYELERYGLPWYRMEDNWRYYQLPTPGHRFDRGVHYNESTGSEMQTALVQEIERHEDIVVFNDTFVIGLLTNDSAIVGASAIDLQTGETLIFETGAVIIATGGAGMMYQVTDMEHGSTGDGITLAYRAGADLIAPEMHQFFPTAFVWPETLRGTIVTSSNLWVFGLRLYNGQGDRFMERHFPEEKENVPRDVLSRAIFLEIVEGRGTENGGVWLDASNIDGWEYLRRERARSYIWPTKLGVNTERFEIAPTYHFTMGGIRIDTNAETNVKGLYAAGEVVGGIHGANRIGGNALPECMVFGAIAGQHAALMRGNNGPVGDPLIRAEIKRIETLLSTSPGQDLRPLDGLRTLRQIMYRHAGIVRHEESLLEGLERLQRLEESDLPRIGLGPGRIFNWDWIWKIELTNMIEQAKLYVEAARLRTESRGAHYRSDYPETDNRNWLKNIVVSRDGDQPCFSTVPVELDYIDPQQYEHPLVRR